MITPTAARTARTPAEPYFLKQNERSFQNTVVEAARYLGYLCFHTEFSIRSAPGFPDLVLIRPGVDGNPGRLVVLELKSHKGKPTPAQEAWIAAFAGVPGVVARVVRPEDWESIMEVLTCRD